MSTPGGLSLRFLGAAGTVTGSRYLVQHGDQRLLIDLLGPHADEHRLSTAELRDLAEKVRYVRSEDESRALNTPGFPSIIVAASGMATGGRVLHHLRALAPHAQHSIVFVGHQAAGTRGASLVAGTERVRVHGQWVPVRAQVHSIPGMSSHADQPQLLEWLSSLRKRPAHVFVTHGEPEAVDALRQAIQERFGWSASVPEHLDEVAYPPRPSGRLSALSIDQAKEFPCAP